MRLNKETSDLVEEVKATIKKPVEKPIPIRFDKGVISTGSTLLDLAISGKRIRGGGIPGGMIMEISGPPSTGKTALLSEILGSVQAKGGETAIKDPEARIDEEYTTIYGVEIDKNNYSRPKTVKQVFDEIRRWIPNPKKGGAICAQGIDSLAALSTDMELGEKGDKMGMRRAKEFSEGLRIVSIDIRENNWLIICTNQEREGDSGPVTPGGKGIPFYASLRIRLTQGYPKWKLQKKENYNGKEIERQMGVITTARIIKSSIDEPFRVEDFYLIWNYGIHDIWANIQYYKDYADKKLTRYLAVDREFQSVEKAIRHIEENNLEAELREMVIDLWEDIASKFAVERKAKVRF